MGMNSQIARKKVSRRRDGALGSTSITRGNGDTPVLDGVAMPACAGVMALFSLRARASG